MDRRMSSISKNPTPRPRPIEITSFSRSIEHEPSQCRIKHYPLEYERCLIRTAQEMPPLGIVLGEEGARWARRYWKQEALDMSRKNGNMKYQESIEKGVEIVSGYLRDCKHQEVALHEYEGGGGVFVACDLWDFRHRGMKLNRRYILFFAPNIQEDLIPMILSKSKKRKDPVIFPQRIEGISFLRKSK